MAEEPPSKSASRWPKVIRMASLMVSCFVLGAVLGPMMMATTISRPQLDVKNTGSAPMLVRLDRLGDKGRVLLEPGGDTAFRVLPGDVLTVFSGHDESAKSKAFQLGMDGDTLRLKTEINADNADRVEARYTFASDWTRG